jgi:hypothetical protein
MKLSHFDKEGVVPEWDYQLNVQLFIMNTGAAISTILKFADNDPEASFIWLFVSVVIAINCYSNLFHEIKEIIPSRTAVRFAVHLLPGTLSLCAWFFFGMYEGVVVGGAAFLFSLYGFFFRKTLIKGKEKKTEESS